MTHDFTPQIKAYYKAISAASLNLNRADHTEASYRPALNTLLTAIQSTLHKESHAIIHEPTARDGFGRPDFSIKNNATGQFIGYIETKTIGSDLAKTIKSDQIKKYLQLSDNLLITDYLQFVWLKGGVQQPPVILASPLEFDSPAFTPAKASIDALSQSLQNLLDQTPEPIARADILAQSLALRGRILRNFLNTNLVAQDNQDNDGSQPDRLHGIYSAFKTSISDNLTPAQFADVFAQMLCYGLFLAKLNADDNNDTAPITLRNAKDHIASNFALIREIFDFLEVLNNHDYRQIKWVVEAILSIINGLDLHEIVKDLSFSDATAGRDDPYIYFYEDFLKAWDSETRQSRGVYYTPTPVVQFIINAVDDILQADFGLSRGLADSNVTALDFAAGTGTFLLEIFRKILDNSSADGHQTLIKQHLLINLYGFEYLIAPYAIAHLKLSRFLKEYNYQMQGKERLQVYLTDTLDNSPVQYNSFMPVLSKEGEMADDIKKKKQILVITGNPPYSVVSMNNGAWISKLINDYKFVDGKPLGEKNPKSLQDDYVKFTRFAQYKMADAEQGIIGIITNHGYLDNITFRGMRQSLMQSFDRIYLLDLHGNSNKKEVMPDGGKDENVFDIKTGVAIAIFVKQPKITKGIFHADIYGKRDSKYQQLHQDFQQIEWQEIKPQSPNYFFIPQDEKLAQEYQQGSKITDIFPINSVGLFTARDKFLIHFSKEKAWQIIQDFINLPVDKAREKYQLGKDSRDWKIHLAQQDVKNNYDENNIKPITYRPFDTRYCYYTKHSKGILSMPRGEIMHHMLAGDNLGLITTRINRQASSHYCFVADKIIDFHLLEDSTCLFPLYLYPPPAGKKINKHTADLFADNDSDKNADPFAGKQRIENISPAFRAKLAQQYPDASLSPEQILAYCYAVLHSPNYRNTYAEFLKRDFPHIPLVPNIAQFISLADIGQRLIDAHLKPNSTRHSAKIELHGRQNQAGDNSVTRTHYDADTQRLYINQTQYFAPIPAHVWQFYIGGYQVLDKYLKSRKNRALTLAEIQHIEDITATLDLTHGLMEEIDGIYGTG